MKYKNKKQVRQEFRDAVFTRDGFKCVFCGCKANLDAHHITDRHELPNGGYVKENGITLCLKHHMDAEKFHMTKGAQWVEGFHPSDLYKKIGSSFVLAREKSLKL